MREHTGRTGRGSLPSTTSSSSRPGQIEVVQAFPIDLSAERAHSLVAPISGVHADRGVEITD